MAQFNMKIAGYTAAVTSLFESTPQYFHKYLTADTPDFSVTVTPENIAFEQADLLEEALRDGFKPRVFTDPFLERAAIQRAFGEFLFPKDILLIHGSALAVDGRGYLFMAHSGTGKSTHTRHWQQHFGSRMVMVNDDKPFVSVEAGGIFLHGSPWSGKHGLDANISVPLAGICLLQRGTENRIDSIAVEDALPMIRKQTFHPGDQTRFDALTAQIARSIPLWQLACTKDPESALVSSAAMHRERM